MTNDIVDNYRQRRMQRILQNENCWRKITLRHLLKCNTVPVDSRGVALTVHRHANGQVHGGFAGLARCRNSWACPVCSALQIRKMRDKLNNIICNLTAAGFVGCMVTFTVPHWNTDSAESVYSLLRTARDKFNRSSAFKLIREFTGKRTMTFTAYECKYNNVTGWHFHAHVLYFIKRELADAFMTDETQAQLQKHYRRAIELANPVLAGRSWRADDALYISRHLFDNADYLVKELCKRTNGSNWSVDPITLIDSDDPRDHERYFEFAEATRGKYRFWYSPGLVRDYYTGDEASKKNDCSTDTGETTVVCVFTYTSWREVLARRDRYRVLEDLIRLGPYGYAEVLFYCKREHLPEPYEWHLRRSGAAAAVAS